MKKLALLLLLAAAGSARAESPRLGSFWFQLGNYRPNIDAEFGGAATPYRDIFGTGRGLMFRGGVAKSLFTQFGSLDLGASAGWFSRKGLGLAHVGGAVSGDSTQIRVLPLSLTLTYRFDILSERYGVPLVPFGRVAFERWQWWVTNGSGATASGANGGPTGSGATNGWSAGLGLAFVLDFLDPTLAREMDRDVGINNTLIYLEVSKAKVDDFGSKKSWDLSDDRSPTWTGGLMFVF